MTPLDRDLRTLRLPRLALLDFRPRRPATGEIDRGLLEIAVRGYRPQEIPVRRILPFLLLFALGCSSTDLGSVADCAAAVATCADAFRALPPGASRAAAFEPAAESTASIAITLEEPAAEGQSVACTWALLAPAASSTPAIVPPAWIRLFDHGLCRVDQGR